MGPLVKVSIVKTPTPLSTYGSLAVAPTLQSAPTVRRNDNRGVTLSMVLDRCLLAFLRCLGWHLENEDLLGVVARDTRLMAYHFMNAYHDKELMFKTYLNGKVRVL